MLGPADDAAAPLADEDAMIAFANCIAINGGFVVTMVGLTLRGREWRRSHTLSGVVEGGKPKINFGGGAPA